MVKSYLRYNQYSCFGMIASVDSNISYDSSGEFIITPALEKVAVWNSRHADADKTRYLSPESSALGKSAPTVTSIAPYSHFAAVGYADGSIRLWNLRKNTCEVTWDQHNGAVTALCYNQERHFLASGSKDNSIKIWDVTSETRLYTLWPPRSGCHLHSLILVTDVVFLDSGKKLVSSSKDKFIKVWDVDTQHCMQTLTENHSEIWSIDVDPNERYLVAGSADPELRFYTILKLRFYTILKHELEDSSLGRNKWEVLKYFGAIHRQSKDRVATVRFNKAGDLLACQVAGKTVEIFHVFDEAQSKRKTKRRIRRKKEKQEKKSSSKMEEVTENGIETQASNTDALVASDVFSLFHTLRAGKKICSISFSPKESSLALSLNNNLVEVYSISTLKQKLAIDHSGHNSDVRSLSLSKDNSLLLSTSHNAVKIWDPRSGKCCNTIGSGYGLCSMFVPVVAKNQYALVGTKEGNIEIIDTFSASCVETVKGHGKSIHSIVGIPDGSGFVTGSADHDIKFWKYDISQLPGGAKRLTVLHERTEDMKDDVLKVTLSSDGKYIAVALLDSTVKVYFADTLKFLLRLYGHKLPVLCMDISCDGNLIVTGSADKNLKIWGLNFGNCHKSLFAHADSVMDVKFVPKTHYMFSVGKDKRLKYWDADKFELLLTLEGHHAEIWCLAVSTQGDFVVTGSHDRSIRCWKRTEEPFFIEEEKEKRLEEIFEADNLGAYENRYGTREELSEGGTFISAGKRTVETLTATDLIIDALEMAEAEMTRIAEHEEEEERGKTAEFQSNVLLLGLSPSDHVLRSLSNIQTSDLEQALLPLPFSDALKLLPYLKKWTSYLEKVDLICRVTTVLLRTHYHQLISTPSARPILCELKDFLHARVKEFKDTVGYNLGAMNHLKQLVAWKSDASFQDANSKLLEVRSWLAKLNDAKATGDKEIREKRRKNERDGHAWVLERCQIR